MKTLQKSLFLFFLMIALQGYINRAVALLPPTAGFSYEHTCMNDTTRFYNESSGAVNLQWFFGDGTETWGLENPLHIYNQAGTYTVTLVAYASDGSSDTYSETIEIFPVPEFDFTYDGDLVFDYGQSLTIGTTGSFANYLWSTGSSSSSITVNQSGYYSLTVTDNNGCFATDSTQQVVVRMPEDEITISSNIITPNDDGINDFFVIEDIENYDYLFEVYIYNRWGQLIYESTDYATDEQWDGKTDNGKAVDAGPYYFVIKTPNAEDKLGTINVLH